MADEENFKSAVAECLKASSDVLECAKSMLDGIRKDKDRNGVSLFEVKNRDFLAYMSELAFVMCQMSRGESIQGSHAVERSVYLRTVLERIRPIEQKMKSQLEKLTSVAFGNATKATQGLRARPEFMKIDNNGEEESGDESDEDKSTTGAEVKKYVPPKLVALHYDEDETAKEERRMEQNRRRALQSSLIQDLRSQYSEAPEEIMEERGNRRHLQAELEKQKFEEDYFVRLQVTKKERHKKKLENRQNILNDLLHFGEYMAMDESKGKEKEHGGSRKRSGKGSVRRKFDKGAKRPKLSKGKKKSKRRS